MKRIAPAVGTEVIRPALPGTSLLLAKLPTLREFMTATAYDDGTARTPGYLWFSNRGTMFEVILFNPDSGSRLPVVAPTMDEVLAAVETVLKLPEAPWQPDRYLSEQLTKKTKKKAS
jgi:hypothetical protein